MNTICLVIDRLHIGYVGAYGNTWIRTPGLDRLAAEGFVFDAAMIESPRLEDIYRAYWSGRHAMGPAGPIDPGRSLPALLSRRSVNTRLVTDDPAVAAHPLTASFGEIVELDLPRPERPADSVEHTLLGQFFAHMLEALDSMHGPLLLWGHFRGLGTAWDAPLDFRWANYEEGDPEPPQTIVVPGKRLPKGYDLDELLGFSQVCAAQVCVLDACLEVLCDWLRTSPLGRETLLLITSTRGFPLGEHLRVGDVEAALYPELVQVPLLVRFPDSLGACDRSPALVQPSDLARTLAQWHGVPSEDLMGGAGLIPVIRGDREAVRQCVGVLGREGEWALATPAWYLRWGDRPELFLRPDDRWCANDVADRCPEIVGALLGVASQYRQAMQIDKIEAFPPLAADLLTGPD